MVSISLGTSGKLDKSGGTLTGPLLLERDPLSDLEAATRRWVLAQIGAGGSGGVAIGADLGGTTAAPLVVGTHLASPLPLAQGGTGAADAPGARTALGLGSAATQNTAAFDAAGAATTALTAAEANAASLYLPLTGGALSGALALGGHKVTGAAAGSVSTDLATLGQVPVVGAVGAGSGVALSSTDATTVNARTPVAHASTHATGGTDPLTPAAIGAAATSALGAAAFLSVGTGAGTVAAGNDTRIAGAAQKSANLADLADAPTARGSLGLGGAATLNVGALAGTVAAGDDSRIAGAVQSAGTGLTKTGTSLALTTPVAAGNLPRLDQITAPQASVGLNNQKLTSLANGTLASDGAAFGQIPLVGAAGAGASVALSSTDASVTNPRTPTAHAATHATGGGDPVTPNAIGALNALTRTPVKTGAYTAQSGDLVPVDTTGGAVTVALAAAPADKSVIAVKHVIQGGANTVTIACGGADVFNKTGGATSLTLALANQGVLLEYTTSAAVWTVLSDDLPLGGLDARYVLASSLPLALASGGTGQATAQAALNALSGAQTSGRFLRGDGANVTLAAIQAGDVPTLNQSTTGTAAGLSATLAIGSGGTGQTGAAAAYNALSPMTTLGDLEYESGANTAARLPGNTSATKNFLTQTGNGTVSAAPAWAAIAAADVPTLNQNTSGTAANVTGVVAVANGGTGLATGPALASAVRFGLVSETLPLYQCNLKGNLASGTLSLALLWWPAGRQLSKLSVYVATAGTSLSGTNSLGLYSASGTLITTTGDMTSQFGSAIWQEGTLASPPTPSVDTVYYVGVLTHAAGTLPAIQAFNLVNAFGAVNGVYGAISVAAQTNHATFTPSSATLVNGAYWFGAR